MNEDAMISRRTIQTYERHAAAEFNRIVEHSRQLSAMQQAELRAQP
jgi:hypothetical protein